MIFQRRDCCLFRQPATTCRHYAITAADAAYFAIFAATTPLLRFHCRFHFFFH